MSGPTDWIRYNGTGLVEDFSSGHRLGEISVIYNESRDVYQMWGSRVYYNETGKPPLYPGYSSVITGVRIGYAESADGINFTFLGDALPSTYDGSNIATDTNYGRSLVKVGPDGTYHMLVGPFGYSPATGLVTQFDYYASPTGALGTWTLIKNAAMSGATFGNAGDIIWDAGIVKIFFEQYSGGTWNVGYASGSDLEHIALYSGNPILNNGRGLSDPSIVRAGNKWVMVTHETVPGGYNTPSQGYYYTNDDILGPSGWVSKGVLLQLVNFSNAPGSPAQAADFCILEAKGKTHLWWTEQSDQSGITTTMFFAYGYQNATLAQIFDPADTSTSTTTTIIGTTSTTTTNAPSGTTSTTTTNAPSGTTSTTTTNAPSGTTSTTTTNAPSGTTPTPDVSANRRLTAVAWGEIRYRVGRKTVNFEIDRTGNNGSVRVMTSQGVKVIK
jgi:hypothetical protein